jgi:hypothetical protein
MSATDNAPDPTTAPAATKDPNRAPAHALWVELSTRITTQRLHYRSGDEETAARSIYSLFGKTRELMEKNPDAVEFHTIAGQMLNTTIRSYTARWHGWMVPDPKLKDKDGQPLTKFADPQLRRAFRGELRELQPYLLGYQKAYNLMRQGQHQDDEGNTVKTWSEPNDCTLQKLTSDCSGTEPKAQIGDPFTSSILPQVWLGGPPPQEGKTPTASNQFPGALTAEDIEKVERTFLNRRRALCMRVTKSAEQDTGDKKPVSEGAGQLTGEANPINDAIGLALSGGGIKSATFCLGVVQELVKRGIFPQVDYLSTVSGGGYFGSFLSSYLGTVKPTAEPEESPAERAKKALLPDEHGTEAKPVRHLRNHSQYLMHGGALGKLNIAGLLATGVLANLIMILPFPLIIALVLAGLNHLGFWDGVWSSQGMLPGWNSGAGLLFAGTGLLLALLWLLLPGVQRWTNKSMGEEKPAQFRAIWEFATLGVAVLTAITGLLYAYPCVIKSYLGAALWFNHWLKDFAPTEKTMSAIMAAIPVILGAFGYIVRTSWIRNLIMKAFIISGPLFYGFVILYVSMQLGVGADFASQPGLRTMWFGALAIVALMVLWSLFLVNLNTLALHRYYRSRLCECYMAVPDSPKLSSWGKLRARIWEGYVPEDEKGFGTVQQVKLSEIGASYAAPYHLLNGIVNLPASKNRNLRGRGGDFFVMTRDYCGSPVVGYAATSRIEEADPRFDLATAMAISAAAANTNMGWRTEGILGSFRFMMTLLNVRLGYWLPNFRLSTKGKDGKLAPIPNKSVGSPYLLAEMSGRIQENLNHLNVSDGGHIENLGVYELLRRKCKFIISADGGCNRDIVGGDLQRLERYAFIDFGITLEYDQAELQPDEEGIARSPAILVKIKYSKTEIGWMIYLRPSITGIEPAYTLDHWKLNPAFPYESILDQLFEEEQFEGYRSLGECAMASMFRSDLDTNSDQLSVESWFQNLASKLLPDNDQAFTK